MIADIAWTVLRAFLIYAGTAFLFVGAVFVVWCAVDYLRLWGPFRSWSEVGAFVRFFFTGRGPNRGA